MAQAKHKNKGRFAGIPEVVMSSPDYCKLGFGARALLLELANQYKGKNNGKLCAVHSQLKARGWSSDTTIRNHVKELVKYNMTTLTKAGQYGGKSTPNYYALTWASIDEVVGFKMDVQPTTLPVRKFSIEARLMSNAA